MIVAILSVLAASAAPPATASPSTGAATLTLRIVGLDSDAGSVLCTLYDREDAWLVDGKHAATTSALPVGGVATCRFPDVDPGRYAVFWMHDVDGNNDMTTNWIGLPAEPWGASRDAPARLGPPRFEAAAFAFPDDGAQVARR